MRLPEEVLWALTRRYVNVHNLFIYLYNNDGRCALKVRQQNKRHMLHRQKLFELQNDLIPLKPKLYNIKLLMSVYLLCNTGHSNTALHSYHNQIS